jgi:hypothetical protein
MRAPAILFDRVQFGSTFELVCVGCHGPLERHQPDLDRPDRLLGTCPDPDCGAWYLIDTEAHVMYTLPEPRSHRRLNRGGSGVQTTSPFRETT